nr:MAG TPA: hypothetical protein [Caudoviricetes sp.]
MFKDSSKKYPLYLPPNGVYLRLFYINEKSRYKLYQLNTIQFLLT